MVQEDGSAVAVRHTHDSDRTSRRIDDVQASANNDEDWKPIDYGHPMRDDPTLVYGIPISMSKLIMTILICKFNFLLFSAI